MFIKTFKIKKPGIMGIAAAVIVVCIIAALAVLAFKCKSGRVYEMKSETQRQEFLAEMGWEVNDEYDDCKAVTIPETFNEVYQNYNELQKQQGFDLEKFKGKQVEIYVYKVKNYPGYEDSDGVYCNLMVYEGQLIGGDVCSAELDGFMQGLRRS